MVKQVNKDAWLWKLILVHEYIGWNGNSQRVFCNMGIGYRGAKEANYCHLQLTICQLSPMSNRTHALQEAKMTSQDQPEPSQWFGGQFYKIKFGNTTSNALAQGQRLLFSPLPSQDTLFQYLAPGTSYF